jgi:hypothetical protein
MHTIQIPQGSLLGTIEYLDPVVRTDCNILFPNNPKGKRRKSYQPSKS